jgi:hypothetical protein
VAIARGLWPGKHGVLALKRAGTPLSILALDSKRVWHSWLCGRAALPANTGTCAEGGTGR